VSVNRAPIFGFYWVLGLIGFIAVFWMSTVRYCQIYNERENDEQKTFIVNCFKNGDVTIFI